MTKKISRISAILFLLALCLSGCSGGSTYTPTPEGETYTPAENVTMLAPFDAGGAIDILGRNIGTTMTTEGIVDCNFVYENQGGAYGQVGLAAIVNQRVGDENVLIPISSTYVTLQALQNDGYSYKDLTIVAQVANDYNMVVVNSDSEFYTMEDLLEAGRERSLLAASSGTGVSYVLASRIGLEGGLNDLRILPCDGSSEQIISLLGNQVDFSCNNPGEIGQYLESGDLRVLAVTSPERLENYPDVPTLKECGLDIEECVSRGLAMAPGVSESARQYWMNRAKELFDSETFQTQYIEMNSMTSEFLTGDEYIKSLEEQWEIYDEVLREIGMIK